MSLFDASDEEGGSMAAAAGDHVSGAADGAAGQDSPSPQFFKRLSLFNEDVKGDEMSLMSRDKSSKNGGALSGPEFLRAFDHHNAHRTNSDKKGTIKLCIGNLSGLKSKVTSSFHTIANLPWRLAAKTESSKRTNNIRFFSIYIDCNPESESTLWSCEAVVEFRLLTQQKSCTGEDFTRHFTNTFSFYSNNWGFPSFIELSEVANPEKGFIKNDKIVIEALIVVQNVVGVGRTPVFDFRATGFPMADCCLVVDGTRLFVSKQYLAMYSPVFEAMFFSHFIEKDKKEIQIEDVILDEFVELLHVIHPSHKPITDDNVEYLLELGDKFQIQYVIDQCENYLQSSSGEHSLVTKLVWADQYALSKLQDACIRSITSAAEIKGIRQHEDYRKFSDTTRTALFEKLLKMI